MRGQKLTFLVIIFLSIDVQSASLLFTQNARTFENQRLSLIGKGLAGACLAFPLMDDSPPCNPAFTSLNAKPTLTAQGYLSNGYDTLEKTQKLIKGNISEGFLNSIFRGENVLQSEADSSINFRTNYLNISWIPTSIRMYSVIRNEANPQVELSVMEEKGYLFQSGGQIFKGFYAGLQARLQKRKFIKKRFELISLATQNGRDQLRPKKQEAYFIEPGFAYVFDYSWKPRISLLAANLGSYSEDYPEIETPPEIQFGFGITQEIGPGTIDVLLDYKSLSYQEDGFEKIHLGVNFQYGSMSLFGGIDTNGISGGLYYRVEKLSAGIMFSTTRTMSNDEETYADTVYTQLGWQI